MNHTLWPVYAAVLACRASACSLEFFFLPFFFFPEDVSGPHRFIWIHSFSPAAETIYNHDYLDCILLSKESGKEGQRLEPVGSEALIELGLQETKFNHTSSAKPPTLNTKGEAKSKEA